ncbi:AtpZ/AtpI family protein [Sphingomicrobium arenosum]|uniref:AtpZ/AtpI family protein n=1 Tax=Sphingomicrobium arenosum TaxID=2233861 RepID=UPI00223F4BDF|nr:AtpZ/AtpI family protein [Sphingomicrobium arenosum]
MAENGSDRQVPETPEDVRIDSLEERLRAAQEREAERTGANRPARDTSEAQGGRVLSYLLGGLFGGALMGWTVDRLAGTGGAALVIGLILGIIGGFWSIVRISTGRVPGDKSE